MTRAIFLFASLVFSTQQLLGQGIAIPSAAYVVSTNAYITDYNNFQNNGSFKQTSGLLRFSGAGQTISGTAATVFQNVAVDATSTTTVSSAAQSITNSLFCNGTLNAGYNLTLMATAVQAAFVDPAGTGSISSLNVQGYLTSAFGYHYISSPFNNETVSQFASQLNLSASFPTFYSYTEDKASSGWNIYTAGSGALTPLSGYAANFGNVNVPQTITQKGNVNNGPLSITVTNHSQPYTTGFNLVGNPYASPLDWDAAAGWTKNNVDNAVYYYNNGLTNQYTGTYSTYINGVSSNGIANNLIPAMQGFFVHVTGSVSTTLTVNNAARNKLTNLKIASIRNAKPHLEYEQGGHLATASSALSEAEPTKPLARLAASFESIASSIDPAVVYFDSKKDQAFDKKLDALKMMNTDEQVPSLYLMSSDQQRMSILAIPSDAQQKTIPLGLKLDLDGNINFEVIDRHQIPFAHIYLHDVSGNSTQEIQDARPITFRLSKGVYENRFELIFSNGTLPNASQLKETLSVYSANGTVNLTLNSFTGDAGEAVLYDMMGREVFKKVVTGAGNHVFDPSLKNGVYILQFNSTTGSHSKNLLLAR